MGPIHSPSRILSLSGAVFAVVLFLMPGVQAWQPSDFFVVSKDFRVSSAIKPGLVKHPMMACLDDDGRLFVAESSGENLTAEELLEKRPYSIRLLTDTDGDGVFDEATTFADKMTFPQGALWIYDSLYVMSPPGMWYLEDADGDGVAEKREEIVTGFEFTGNAADVHGPFLHPNGRLFWCHGRKGHEVISKETGEVLSKAKGARIWSCQLDGSDIQIHAGGGMDNPVEVDFTETGEIIGSVNLFYGRPRGDVLVHWLHRGVYPRRDQEQVLAEFTHTGPLLSELHNFGHVAVSGMCRYRSGKLKKDWKDQWLVSHFNSNQVTLTKLEKDGASYKAVKTEPVFQLLRPNSHLTDVLEDRNGDLLVIDTGGWFRRGCPNSQVARPDVAGGIYRISKAKGQYKKPEFPGSKVWKELEGDEIAKRLDSNDPFIQERAVTEFAIRGHSAIPEIRMILEDKKSSARARRNSIWTLARMNFSESPDLISLALQDPDPMVQIAACNAFAVTRSWQKMAASEKVDAPFELERNKSIASALGRLVRSGEPAVARNAAVALGAMGETRAIGSLFGRVGRESTDRTLQHALIVALMEIGDSERVLETLRAGNERQKIAALWALEGMPHYDLEILDVVLYLDSENEALRQTVAEIVKKHEDWDAAIANQFFLFTDDLNEQREALIMELAPAFISSPPMMDFVAYLLTREEEKAAALAKRLLPTLGSFPLPEAWEETLGKWLAEPETVDLALNCLRHFSTNQFDTELAAMIEDEKYPPLTRVRALMASSKKKALSDDAFQLLETILTSDEEAEHRSEAIEILVRSALNTKQRTALAGLLKEANPVELSRLIKVYRRVDDEAQARILAASLVSAPGFGALDMAQVRGLFSGFDSEIRKPIDEAIAKIESENSQKRERMEEIVSQLEKGDPEKGKKHFEAGKGACLTCHKIGETGREIGPDLSKLAKIRQPIDFVESILYPSESIGRDYESFIVKTNDDAQQMGLIQRETEKAIYLTDLAGQVKEIPRATIKSIEPSDISLMPAGLEQSMTRGELLDMISFLMTLK